MPRPGSSHPTELELEILKILWDESPLLVRDVRQRLGERGRELAHSSVITVMNIMVRKRFLKRRKRANALLFVPAIGREEVSSGIIGDVVSRVFDGSTSAMVLSLLETGDIDDDELREIRELIRRKAKEQP